MCVHVRVYILTCMSVLALDGSLLPGMVEVCREAGSVSILDAVQPTPRSCVQVRVRAVDSQRTL